MQNALVLQAHGKYMLIKILSLPLLLVLRRQLETPPTPFPHQPPPCPPPNGHHPPTADTAEKHLALQPPPGGKRDKDKKPPGEEKPDQGPGAESNGEGGKPKDPPPEDPQNPPSGEGEVEGGPSPGQGHDPDPEQENLLQGVALRLVTWERQFDHLVETIVDDLRNYWTKLKTPQ